MTAIEIMTQARERLGDDKKHRWTENRLLTLVSQGHIDICKQSGCIRKEVYIPLVVDRAIYSLPSDCYDVKRVEFQGSLVDMYTRGDQDEQPKPIKGSFAVTKSNINTDRIELLPPLEQLDDINTVVIGDTLTNTNVVVDPLLGVGTEIDLPYDLNSDYGVITGISLDVTNNEPSIGYGELSGTSNDDSSISIEGGEPNEGVVTAIRNDIYAEHYGMVTAVEGHTVSGSYGVTGSIIPFNNVLKVYYSATPRRLTFSSAVLEIPNIWERLILSYVVGIALQDDNDANNIQRGELELAKYEKELGEIKLLSSKDFSSSSKSKYTTKMRRI